MHASLIGNPVKEIAMGSKDLPRIEARTNAPLSQESADAGRVCFNSSTSNPDQMSDQVANSNPGSSLHDPQFAIEPDISLRKQVENFRRLVEFSVDSAEFSVIWLSSAGRIM